MAKKKTKANSSRVPATKEQEGKTVEKVADKQPRLKPISLHPLTFDEAIDVILRPGIPLAGQQGKVRQRER
ncbi:MAG: hypothetical protein ABR538_02490 [Candidatus Binatia bacterium]